MPEAVRAYAERKDLLEVQRIQTALVEPLHFSMDHHRVRPLGTVGSRQIGPRSPTLVFMLHLHGVMGPGWFGRMDAGSSLDAGLFVGREHKFIVAQRLI